MRRLFIVAGTVAAILYIASPAQAFSHGVVKNVYLHAVADVLTLAVVAAPLWTAYLWGARRRGLLLALVAVVQLPVAVIGFVPVANPTLHLILLPTALAITGASLWTVRHAVRPQIAPAAVRPAP